MFKLCWHNLIRQTLCKISDRVFFCNHKAKSIKENKQIKPTAVNCGNAEPRFTDSQKESKRELIY